MQTTTDYVTSIKSLKTQLDALRPFSTAQIHNLRQRFRIGYIHHTDAIEGNTLTLSEVKVLLEDGITIGGKSVRELTETLNHGDVMTHIEDLFGDPSKIKIDEITVMTIYTTLMRNLLPVEVQVNSRRKTQVYISWSDEQLPQPSLVPMLMQEYFASAICTPKTLEDVAQLHYQFVKIHPFMDGNGRMARLLMNIGLVQLWYFPIIIPVITRHDYIASLQGDNFTKRYEFFLWQVHENHKDYLRFLDNK